MLAELVRRGLTARTTEKAPAPISFRQFVEKVRPSFQWYPHAMVLAEVLQTVAEGEIKRLMIFMPPRHGKSEETSRLFSAYYLLRYPAKFVGINSYAADLAYTLSRAARENYRLAGGDVKADADAVKHWETPQGGGMWAAGVGGPITGKGFHLGIIDDPLKNSEEAFSEIIREKQKDWFRSTFYTREEPGGAIVIIQTRWHEDDLSGWLMNSQPDGEDVQTDDWFILTMPALSESADVSAQLVIPDSYVRVRPEAVVFPDVTTCFRALGR